MHKDFFSKIFFSKKFFYTLFILQTLFISQNVGFLTYANISNIANAAEKKPNLNQLYHASNLPRTHLDYSMFHFVPRGDKMIEQPDQARLLFKKPTGQPDGYAQRRGTTVFYYDASGKAIRIQRLTDAEIARLNHPY